MDVSIIIPVLNEAAHVSSAIERAWKAGASEVIVVDGGSSDNTPPIAGHANCLLITSRRGRAVQQNAGAQRASGDVLLFLHADTWLEANGVDQIRRSLDDARCPGGAFRQRINANGTLYRYLEWGNAWRAKRGRPYGDQGIFIRRRVFHEIGGFPEVDLMEDLLLARRLARQGRLVVLPGPLHVSARRWERHGVIRQTLRNWALLGAHQMGVSPNRLARFYPRHDTGSLR